MINETLTARAAALIRRDPPLHGWRTQDKVELASLAGAILEKSVCQGCPGEMDRIFLELRDVIKPLIIPTMEKATNKKQFTLPEGAVLHDMEKGGVYTNANLTDDAALSILSRNPKAIKQFAAAPSDWEDQADKFAKAEAAKAKKAAVPAPGPAKTETKEVRNQEPKKPADKPASGKGNGNKSKAKEGDKTAEHGEGDGSGTSGTDGDEGKE